MGEIGPSPTGVATVLHSVGFFISTATPLDSPFARGIVCISSVYTLEMPGMPLMRDLTGKSFGYWLVICRDTDPRYRGKGSHWVCQCTLCGTLKTLQAGNLTGGYSTRCAMCRTGIGRKHVFAVGDVVAGRRIIAYRKRDKRHVVVCETCGWKSLTGTGNLQAGQGCPSCSRSGSKQRN